jgi:hypothetical protein
MRPDFFDTWRDLQRSNATLASPYFHPTFTGIVARTCGNVEVAIVGNGRRLQAIFPFQRLPGSASRSDIFCPTITGLFASPIFDATFAT